MLVPLPLRAAHTGHRMKYASDPAIRPMSVTRDLVGRRQDETEFPVDISLSPLKTAAGMFIICSIRDISEKKQLEEQFRQAQKLESIGRLAGGVAHDFNNLLTGILGYVDLIRKELPASPSRILDDLQEIKKGAMMAADVARQLLAYSRKQIMRPDVVCLNDILLHVDKMLRRLLGEDIEMLILAAPDAGLVKVDICQIEQVIVNLAVNARDAMPGGGKIMIETSNVTHPPLTKRGKGGLSTCRPASMSCCLSATRASA